MIVTGKFLTLTYRKNRSAGALPMIYLTLQQIYNGV